MIRVHQIAFCFFCALVSHLVFVHVGSGILQSLPSWHEAHIANAAPSPLQFRLFSFFFPALLHKFGMGIIDAYLLERFLSLFLAFLVFYNVCVRFGLSALESLMLVSMLCLYYAASTQAHIQPAEEPNLLAFAVVIYLLVATMDDRLRFAILVPVFVLGAFNKDTVGFLIPLILIHQMVNGAGWRRAVGIASGLSILFIAIYVGIRLFYGTDRPYLGGFFQYSENYRFIMQHPVKGLMWLIPSLIPLALILLRWSYAPIIAKCFIPSVIFFLVGHLTISRIEEFRTYTPLALILWPSVMVAYRQAGTAVHLTWKDKGSES
jgi:hypothetical protein